MESLVFSLSLIVVLAAFASLIDAAARVAVEWGASDNKPNWTGENRPAKRWTRALTRDWRALTQFGVRAELRRKFGYWLCLVTAIISFAVIPLAPAVDSTTSATMIAADVDVALLLVLAMLTISIFGEVFVGTNKQQVDIAAGYFGILAALGLSAIGIVRLSHSWRIDNIVLAQSELGIGWLARQPLGCAAILLCLVWQMSRIRPTVQRGVDRSDRADNQDGGDMLQLASRLQLIVTTYLFVNLFLGGWHNWGVDLVASDAAGKWGGWCVRFCTMHLKVVGVLLWLIWLRFVRLQDVSMSACRGYLVVGALISALLNAIVTEFSERQLATQPDVWKAAVAWGVLFVVLIVIGLYSQRVVPD